MVHVTVQPRKSNRPIPRMHITKGFIDAWANRCVCLCNNLCFFFLLMLYQTLVGGKGRPCIRKTTLCTPVVFASSKLASYHRNAIDKRDFNFNVVDSFDQIKEGKNNLISVWEDNVELELGVPTDVSCLLYTSPSPRDS